MWGSSWFEREILDTGRLPILVGLAAFVVTFLVTRVITRMIRAGRGPFKDHVSPAGVHVHHAVPGVIMLIVGAFTALGSNTDSGWALVAAALVGAGTSLVLDEFALILRLTDVYWSEQGRVSVEMVSLAVACLVFVLVGVSPVSMPTTAGDLPPFVSALVVLGWHVLMILTCVAKGKYRTALFGAFVPTLALIGAIRLARPESRWASRRYGSRRMAEATERARRWDRRYGSIGVRLSDFVAGKPSEPDVAPEPPAEPPLLQTPDR